ncbi:MAG: hypothetical protein FJ247_01385 [Nitrospira sp.]|nr:hypothetical protein [Nitrospira sp.]
MIAVVRNACFCCLVLLVCSSSLLEAEDKTPGALLVKDTLVTPGQPVTVEARLSAKGLVSPMGLGGELLELIEDGKAVATGMTGGDGRTLLTYRTKAQGVIPVEVRLGNSPRILPAEGRANVAVWERRNPMIAIEVAALMDTREGRNPESGIAGSLEAERKPMPDAADELVKLTQYYYRVIYVAVLPSSDADELHVNAEVRTWLKAHHFPPGHIVVLPPGGSSWGAKIDSLHAAGWKNLKTGIGRSKAFAEPLIQRRLDVVVISDPAAGEVIRKAKAAKVWKEVRKHL